MNVLKKHVGIISFPMHITFVLTTMLAMFFHLTSSFGNPGDIISMASVQFIRYIDSLTFQLNGTVNSDGMLKLLPSVFCYSCLCEKKKRSKHSRLRDKCVLMFDHECPWVNNSVGLYTHKALILLLSTTSLGQIIFMYCIFKIFVVTFDPSDGEDFNTVYIVFDQLFQNLFTFFIVLLHSVVLMFNFFLLLSQVRLIFQGHTTYESIVYFYEQRRSSSTCR